MIAAPCRRVVFVGILNLLKPGAADSIDGVVEEPAAEIADAIVMDAAALPCEFWG